MEILIEKWMWWYYSVKHIFRIHLRISSLRIFIAEPSVCNQVGWFHHFEDPEILRDSVWFLVFLVLNLSEPPGVQQQESHGQPEFSNHHGWITRIWSNDPILYNVVLYYIVLYHSISIIHDIIIYHIVLHNSTDMSEMWQETMLWIRLSWGALPPSSTLLIEPETTCRGVSPMGSSSVVLVPCWKSLKKRTEESILGCEPKASCWDRYRMIYNLKNICIYIYMVQRSNLPPPAMVMGQP